MPLSPIRLALASIGMVVALAPTLAAQAASISYTAGGHTTSITDSACTGSFVVSGSTLVCQSAGGGGNPPVTTPTNCTTSIATVPSPLTSAGGTVTFGVSGCTSATGQINYNWVKNGAYVAYGASTPSWTETLPANTSTTIAQTTSYQVNVCDPGNGQCTGPLPAAGPLTATVPAAGTINPTGGGGGGGGGGGTGGGATGPISCNGFTSTIVLDLAYVPNVQSDQTVFSFTNGDIVVGRFTTPANLANHGDQGQIGGGETGDPSSSVFRYAVLSTAPCDFTPNGLNIDATKEVNVTFSATGNGVALQPSTTYYFNIKNTNQTGVSPSCNGNCPIKVTLKPK